MDSSMNKMSLVFFLILKSLWFKVHGSGLARDQGERRGRDKERTSVWKCDLLLHHLQIQREDAGFVTQENTQPDFLLLFLFFLYRDQEMLDDQYSLYTSH